jgi:hypothetical protein
MDPIFTRQLLHHERKQHTAQSPQVLMQQHCDEGSFPMSGAEAYVTRISQLQLWKVHPGRETSTDVDSMLVRQHIIGINRMIQGQEIPIRIAIERWLRSANHQPDLVQAVMSHFRLIEEHPFVEVMSDPIRERQGLNANPDVAWARMTASYQTNRPKIKNKCSVPEAKPGLNYERGNYRGGPQSDIAMQAKLNSDARFDAYIEQSIRTAALEYAELLSKALRAA